MTINPQGVYTALITPFDQQGNLDEDGLRQLIRLQIANGIDGVTPIGTTGESPTLAAEEKARIMAIARAETQGRCALMIGTGSYATSQTIENTRQAAEHGADMALVVTPYYNRPTQEGLYHHFKTIANAVDIPIVIYNIQSRTGQNLHTETLQRLLDVPGIIAVKEASGSIPQISDIIEIARKERPEFKILSGDDALTLPLMALGGHGVISVAGNLVPSEIKALTTALQKGDFALAREHHFRLMPLFRALFIETNPIPIKAAMTMCGLPAGTCRLPLYPLSRAHAKMLKDCLQGYAKDTTQLGRTPLSVANTFAEY